MWKVYPTSENIILKDYENGPKEDEEEHFIMPEDTKEKMELDEDGLYEVMGVGSEVEETTAGDIVAIPNRTVQEFTLPSGNDVQYVHKDRVVAIIEEK